MSSGWSHGGTRSLCVNNSKVHQRCLAPCSWTACFCTFSPCSMETVWIWPRCLAIIIWPKIWENHLGPCSVNFSCIISISTTVCLFWVSLARQTLPRRQSKLQFLWLTGRLQLVCPVLLIWSVTKSQSLKLVPSLVFKWTVKCVCFSVISQTSWNVVTCYVSTFAAKHPIDIIYTGPIRLTIR